MSFFFFIIEPSNIFHGAYKTDCEPIRISYHQNVHYNSVIDPYKATIGVGLGLPGHIPGVSTCNTLSGGTVNGKYGTFRYLFLCANSISKS